MKCDVGRRTPVAQCTLGPSKPHDAGKALRRYADRVDEHTLNVAPAPAKSLLKLTNSDCPAPAQDEFGAFDRDRAWRPRAPREQTKKRLNFGNGVVRFATQPLGVMGRRKQVGEADVAVGQRVRGFAEQDRNCPRRQTYQDCLRRFALSEDPGTAAQTRDTSEAKRSPLCTQRHPELPTELESDRWERSGEDNVRARHRLWRERDAFDQAFKIGTNGEGAHHKAIVGG